MTDIAKGMLITLRHLFKKPVTLQYPDERWDPPERFRGFLGLTRDFKTGEENCIGCLNCEKVCPVDCITILTAGKGREMYAKEFYIDYMRCMYCGLCQEACPTTPKSIVHTHQYETVGYDREALVFDKDRLYDVWEKENNYNGPRAWGKFFGLRKLEEERRPVAEKESLEEQTIADAEKESLDNPEEKMRTTTNKFQAPNTVEQIKSKSSENPEG